MAKKRKLPTPTKFQVGDRVRVKQGIRDAEYPDVPLGGWAGTISEVHDHGMYTVRWSHETLAAIHSVFQKRSERDGMDLLAEYWLGDDDLEFDPGGPLMPSQQPAEDPHQSAFAQKPGRSDQDGVRPDQQRSAA